MAPQNLSYLLPSKVLSCLIPNRVPAVRDRVNYAEKVSAGKVFPKLLEATLISKKQDRMSKILELYDEIFSAVDLYSLHCTISDDAVTAAYNAICK